VFSFVFVKSVNALPEAPIQLSQTLTDTSDFISTNITISPDGNYVIYKLFDMNTPNAADLYSAPIDGSSDPVMISDGNSKIDDFIISPDSKWVIYNSDHEELDKNELYLASIDNSSAVTKINSNFIGTGTGGIEQFVITDDSQYVIYAQTAGNSTSLYSALLNNTPAGATLLNNISAGYDISLELLYEQNSEEKTSFSIDNDYVVYTSNERIEDINEIFSVAVDGSSAPVRLNSNVISGSEVSNYKVSSDGEFVIYTADHQTLGKNEIFGNLIQGGLHRKLNNSIGNAADINDFSISLDNQYVVFSVLNNSNQNRNKLFSTNVTNANGPVLVADAIDNTRDITNFIINPNSDQVVFMADFDTLNQVELYKAPLDNTGQETKVNGSLLPNVDVYDFRISPDGERIVIQAGAVSNPPFLFSVDSAGLEDITRLTPLFPAGNSLFKFEISPDSEFVIYISTQETNNLEEIFMVATDGSEDSIKLNSELIDNASEVLNFKISADNSYVIYHADQDTLSIPGVYSVLLVEPVEIPVEEELCFPIKASNGGLAVICI